jgi:hypothetical protein
METDLKEIYKYFKIQHVHHNLQRTRAQLKLLKSMEEQYVDMKKIIDKIH